MLNSSCHSSTGLDAVIYVSEAGYIQADMIGVCVKQTADGESSLNLPGAAEQTKIWSCCYAENDAGACICTLPATGKQLVSSFWQWQSILAVLLGI